MAPEWKPTENVNDGPTYDSFASSCFDWATSCAVTPIICDHMMVRIYSCCTPWQIILHRRAGSVNLKLMSFRDNYLRLNSCLTYFSQVDEGKHTGVILKVVRRNPYAVSIEGDNTSIPFQLVLRSSIWIHRNFTK